MTLRKKMRDIFIPILTAFLLCIGIVGNIYGTSERQKQIEYLEKEIEASTAQLDRWIKDGYDPNGSLIRDLVALTEENRKHKVELECMSDEAFLRMQGQPQNVRRDERKDDGQEEESESCCYPFFSGFFSSERPTGHRASRDARQNLNGRGTLEGNYDQFVSSQQGLHSHLLGTQGYGSRY